MLGLRLRLRSKPAPLTDLRENLPQLRLKHDGETDKNPRRDKIQNPGEGVESQSQRESVDEDHQDDSPQQRDGSGLVENPVPFVEEEGQNGYVEQGTKNGFEDPAVEEVFHQVLLLESGTEGPSASQTLSA